MFCPDCGAESTDDANFCKKCGADLKKYRTEEPEITEDELDLDDEFLSQFNDVDLDDEPGRKRRSEKRETKEPRHAIRRRYIILAELLIIILILVVFYRIAMRKSSADAVVKRYMQACEEENWNQAYDLLEASEGKLLQRASYVSVMENSSEDLIRYEIAPEEKKSNHKDKFYTVQYTTGDKETKEVELEVRKQKEKMLLFFDTWKISPDSLLTEGHKISVPRGAAIAVDGVKLEDNSRTESQDSRMDTYAVTVYTGTHSLQVAMPWCNLYKGEFAAYDGAETTNVTSFSMSEDGKTAIESKMQNALKKIYQAAMAKDDFSQIESLFEDEAKDGCRQAYETLEAELDHAGQDTLNTIKFDHFECRVYDGEDYSPDGVRVTMSYDYSMGYTHKEYVLFYESSEDRVEDGSGAMDATFIYTDDTYKISAINIPGVF